MSEQERFRPDPNEVRQPSQRQLTHLERDILRLIADSNELVTRSQLAIARALNAFTWSLGFMCLVILALAVSHIMGAPK